MMEADLDAAHDGHVAVFTELLRDDKFRELVGYMATVYAVHNRRVTSIDQRSFTAAKERLTAFVARTSGWQTKLSRDTRNGSWRRGTVHPPGEVERRQDTPDLVGVGGRGSGVRRVEHTQGPAADSPKEVAHRQGPRLKDCCPSCQAKTGKIFKVPDRHTRTGSRLVCPHCVRKVKQDEHA